MVQSRHRNRGTHDGPGSSRERHENGGEAADDGVGCRVADQVAGVDEGAGKTRQYVNLHSTGPQVPSFLRTRMRGVRPKVMAKLDDEDIITEHWPNPCDNPVLRSKDSFEIGIEIVLRGTCLQPSIVGVPTVLSLAMRASSRPRNFRQLFEAIKV